MNSTSHASVTSMSRAYRPWLDGIRAVCIFLVLLEHGADEYLPDWNFGGTGVGIFFVLSGYLITGILLDEFSQTKTIAIKQFYIRRLARLMPALLLVVVIGDLIFLALGRYQEIKASFFSLSYLMNYATLAYGQYLPGFGHTWSLAVEEHFYLLWPLAMLWLLTRKSDAQALRIILLACLIVLLWRFLLIFLGAPPRLLYVGSLERADTLLYGCAAAFAIRMGWRPGMLTFALGVILVAYRLFGEDQPPQLQAVALGIGGALMLAGLDFSSGSCVRKALSWRPIIFIGAISYSIYLWHEVLFHTADLLNLDTPLHRLAVVLITIIIAKLSYKYIEIPIRDRFKATGIVTTKNPVTSVA